jgi:hypothetical protein
MNTNKRMKVRVTQIERGQLCIPNRVLRDKNELCQFFDAPPWRVKIQFVSIRVDSWFLSLFVIFVSLADVALLALVQKWK